MTLRKARYVHEHKTDEWHRRRGKYNGWTVKLSPCDEPGKVYVQTALCSKKDNFSYKLGRKTADEAPQECINVVELPTRLATLSWKMYYNGKCKNDREDVNVWAWVLKYFV